MQNCCCPFCCLSVFLEFLCFSCAWLQHFLNVCSLLTGISQGCLTVRGSCSSLWWGLMAHWVCLTMGRPAFCSRQSAWQSATGTTPLLTWLRRSSTPTHLWTLKAPSAQRRKLRKTSLWTDRVRSKTCLFLVNRCPIYKTEWKCSLIYSKASA